MAVPPWDQQPWDQHLQGGEVLADWTPSFPGLCFLGAGLASESLMRRSAPDTRPKCRTPTRISDTERFSSGPIGDGGRRDPPEENRKNALNRRLKCRGGP